MAKLLRPRQVSRTFVRNIVETVEQRSHRNDKGEQMWKYITLLVGLPAVGLSMTNCYMIHQEEKDHERPEFIHYPYMKLMNKRFPWGDGKHSLFHNPKTNYIPGIGYEE